MSIPNSNHRISDDQLRRDAFLILQSLNDYLSTDRRKISVTAGFCRLLISDMKRYAKQSAHGRKPIGRETESRESQAERKKG